MDIPAGVRPRWIQQAKYRSIFSPPDSTTVLISFTSAWFCLRPILSSSSPTNRRSRALPSKKKDGRFSTVSSGIGWSSAVLMCVSSSSAVEEAGSVKGWVCVLQDGNTNTAGRSTLWSAAHFSASSSVSSPVSASPLRDFAASVNAAKHGNKEKFGKKEYVIGILETQCLFKTTKRKRLKKTKINNEQNLNSFVCVVQNWMKAQQRAALLDQVIYFHVTMNTHTAIYFDRLLSCRSGCTKQAASVISMWNSWVTSFWKIILLIILPPHYVRLSIL